MRHVFLLALVAVSSLFSLARTQAQTLVTLPKAATYEVTLAWSAPANSPDPVAGYEAFRAPSGSTAYAQMNAAPVTVTTYTDPTVEADETYNYIVESVDAEGFTSAPSNVASVPIPLVPVVLVVGVLKAT